MNIAEVSIIHHIVIVLMFLWTLSSFNYCHPTMYLISFIYLYLVHKFYVLRLWSKLQFEERKQANQRKLLSDSESVRWLNHTVEKMWPICMEHIASQKFLIPIAPWFLDKYKPWTADQAMLQQLYLGRNPPMFTEMRVLSRSSDDDHLVMELGMNFLAADDMSAVLAVKLRKRLGFGMWAKLHVTGMHIKGKVLVGVKFIREWPFLGRLRYCFVESPYLQMTVKPIFSRGLDFAEVPGIAGWLDKLLAFAIEQTLVEPNVLVVDVEKFASTPTENWFSVDEKDSIAYAKVEIIEAANMKPSDLNGFADPYVKGQLGSYNFRTKIQKKTLTPKWQEEFKIPICTWESPNTLALEVLDKDHFFDDTLGNCYINISNLRGGRRHDMWLPLLNIKIGRLHIAVTVIDADGKVPTNEMESTNPIPSGTDQKVYDSIVTLKKAPKIADEIEPIKLEGKSRQFGAQIHRDNNDSIANPQLATFESDHNGIRSSDENPNGNKPKSLGTVRRSLRKIGSVFHTVQKGVA